MTEPTPYADYERGSQMAMPMPETVQSVVRCQENGPLVAAAAQLWIGPDDLVLDATYGRGLFWTKFRPRHLVTHDQALDGVDFRRLPEADESVDVVVFDPPYISTGGTDTSTLPEFLDRYGLVGSPKGAKELLGFVATGLCEANRVVRPRGRILVKCMDYVESGRLVLGRHHVVTVALALGLEQVDEFVHVSGTGPGAWERQVHSRRAHSFLCVFQKGKPRPSVNGKRRTHAGHHETCWFPHAECTCDLPAQFDGDVGDSGVNSSQNEGTT